MELFLRKKEIANLWGSRKKLIVEIHPLDAMIAGGRLSSSTLVRFFSRSVDIHRYGRFCY